MENERPSAECLLVVDSEVIVRHAIADYLRDCGYRVIEAANSDEALVVMAESDLSFRVVLCDAQVEGTMNGFELRNWIERNRPDLRVILAGNVAAAASAAADVCEEGPHLQRPYDPQGAIDYIKRLLASKG